MAKPFKIMQLDAIEFLKTIPDESVNLILTDPAYESLERWRNVGTTSRLGFAKKEVERTREDGTVYTKKVVDRSKEANWFPIFHNDRLEEFLNECKRVLKKNSHMYIHCDETTRDVMRPMFDRVGLKFWKSLIWDKKAIGMGYHWRSRYEFIVFLEKGKRNLNNLGYSDLLEHKRLKGKDYYPTQKPLSLARQIVENSSKPGEIVLDPFMGAGTVGVAAIRAGCRFWGCDISDKAVERCQTRLTKEVERQQAKETERATEPTQAQQLEIVQ